MEGAFPDSVLEQSGSPVMKIPAGERRYSRQCID
jgi:hypothetical protein